MTRAAQHYSVSAGEIKHLARLLWCFDIAVGEDWNANRGFYIADGLVFGLARIKVRTRAPVDSDCLDARGFGNSRDAHTITIVTIPAGTDLQRDRHAHRAHHGLENLRHERLIAQQRG